MHKLRGLLYLTFRELWAKKIVVGLFVVSTLVWVVLMLFMNVEEVEGGISMLRLFGSDVAASGAPASSTAGPAPGAGAAPADTSAFADTAAAATDTATVDPEMSGPRSRPTQQQSSGRGALGISFEQFTVAAQTVVSQAAYWIVILLGLFSAAPLFARMLESGHVDLLLSKPMSRAKLFSGHVLGVLLMVLTLATYLFGAVWLILSIKLGVWNAKFLFSILVLVGMFAVLYGVVALLTVWTESPALALIVTYGVIFVSIILAFRSPIYESLGQPGDLAFGALYYVVPNFAEVGGVAAQLLHGDPVTRWNAVASTAAVGALLYLSAGFLFSRRDF
jgi:ABC-type transport system involved in multi-copper enzyme maturation permease subunit